MPPARRIILTKMIIKKLTLTIAVTASLLLPFAVPNFAFAGDADHNGKGGIHISENLRKALQKEMLAVQDGMMKLVPAIASGDWATVSRTADNIKKTYIMKQKLTQAQLKELHSALPAGFKRLDHRFHKTAGRLAHAAERKDAELAVFYFYKLNESCVTCHSAYAKQRFPAFSAGGTEDGEHH